MVKRVKKKKKIMMKTMMLCEFDKVVRFWLWRVNINGERKREWGELLMI